MWQIAAAARTAPMPYSVLDPMLDPMLDEVHVGG
jgi:hypothetical protein